MLIWGVAGINRQNPLYAKKKKRIIIPLFFVSVNFAGNVDGAPFIKPTREKEPLV